MFFKGISVTNRAGTMDNLKYILFKEIFIHVYNFIIVIQKCAKTKVVNNNVLLKLAYLAY